jgi:hypothetical protein
MYYDVERSTVVGTSITELEREIDLNLEFFRGKLPELIAGHRDRYALLRKQEIVGIYDTIRDAKMTGDRFFPDGLFSIQKITDKSLDLGIFSHAVHLGDA